MREGGRFMTKPSVPICSISMMTFVLMLPGKTSFIWFNLRLNFL